MLQYVQNILPDNALKSLQLNEFGEFASTFRAIRRLTSTKCECECGRAIGESNK